MDYCDMMPGQVLEGDIVYCNGQNNPVLAVGPNAVYAAGKADIIRFEQPWTKNFNKRNFYI